MDFLRSISLKNRSVFIAWLLSYFLLLLIPVSANAFVYFKAESVIENDVKNANSAVLNQSLQVIDSGLMDINRFTRQVSLNERFRQLMNLKEPSDKYDYYTIFQAVDDFICYRVFAGFIHDYFIYFSGSNRILTGNGMLDRDLFFESNWKSFYGSTDISREHYYKILQGEYSGEYLIPSGIDENGNRWAKSIIFEQVLPLSKKSGSSTMTLVISLNQKRFQDIIQNMRSVNGQWGMILDRNDQLLFSTDTVNNDELRTLDFKKLSEDKGFLYDRINDKKVVISYITSAITGWKYVSVIPYEAFWSKVDFIKRITLVCTLLCVLLGIAAACYFTRKNYSPVNELVHLFDKGIGSLSGRKCNEYGFIRDAMVTALSENKEINQKLRQQDAALRTNFLINLLKGRYNDGDLISKTLHLYDIQFDSDSFAVMLFRGADSGSFAGRRQTERNPEDKWRLTDLITRVVEEAASCNSKCFFMEIDEMLACLINLSESDSEMSKNEMLRIAGRVYGLAQINNDIDFNLSISNAHSTFPGISLAYREALDAIEYGVIMENTGIIHYDNIKVLNNDYNYSIEIENRLINCIRAGDAQGSKRTVNEVIDGNMNKKTLSNEAVKCFMFDLVGTMLKIKYEVGIICNGFFEEKDIIGRLLQCKGICEMKLQMLGILDELCSFIQDNKSNKNKWLFDDIIQFINENYSDMNLSVMQIADKFDLTSPYLARLFKEYMGEGLFEYMSRIRIERAEELLKERGSSIKDVALKVGYCSSNVFIRVFKKYTGVTPGIFKCID